MFWEDFYYFTDLRIGEGFMDSTLARFLCGDNLFKQLATKDSRLDF